MSRRVIVHPGFHKTGTSSIQHLLWFNRARLLPFVEIFQLRHLRHAAQIAMRFSRSGNPMHLIDMAHVLEGVFKDFAKDDSRDIVLTCEGLSGHLPGWREVETYAAAPTLAAYLAGWLQERFAGAEITFVYTLRDVESWLSSAWRHHLSGQRLTLDQAEFSHKYTPAANLLGVTNAIAAELPDISLKRLWLNDISKLALGPGEVLIDLLDLPLEARASIKPVLAGNAGPDIALAEKMLELNRGALRDRLVIEQKAKWLAEAGKSGWQKRPRSED